MKNIATQHAMPTPFSVNFRTNSKHLLVEPLMLSEVRGTFQVRSNCARLLLYLHLLKFLSFNLSPICRFSRHCSDAARLPFWRSSPEKVSRSTCEEFPERCNVFALIDKVLYYKYSIVTFY